jgi:hypothetical protein
MEAVDVRGLPGYPLPLLDHRAEVSVLLGDDPIKGWGERSGFGVAAIVAVAGVAVVAAFLLQRLKLR